MKYRYTIFLTKEQHSAIMAHAQQLGLSGRATLTKFMERISQTDLILVDENLKKAMSLLKVEIK